MTKYELYLKPSMVWDNRLDYQVSSSQGVYEFLRDVVDLENRDREVVLVLALNAKGDVIGLNETSVGDLSSAIIHPREVMKFLVSANAAACIFAHNHPSGDARPSNEDLRTTEKLVDVGILMGIKVIDHIIVAHGEYYSMKEHGEIR